MAQTRPLILLTNDDGIRSPGLLAAAQAVCGLGELLIVAPATQQTGMGRGSPPVSGGAVTEEHLSVDCRDLVAYAVTGSPAQAVAYGALVLAPRRPVLVISGINYGENLGTSVTVSGTVGAALQAAEFDIPGLAVSLETPRAYHYRHGDDVNWAVAAWATRIFAGAMLRQQLPFDVDVLKVDVPADATIDTPWRMVRQSRQSYYHMFCDGRRPPPGEQVHLDYSVRVDWETLEADSDVRAFAAERAIAVTPLSKDLTSRTDLGALERQLRSAS